MNFVLDNINVKLKSTGSTGNTSHLGRLATYGQRWEFVRTVLRKAPWPVANHKRKFPTLGWFNSEAEANAS
jgi:hypothetical protein